MQKIVLITGASSGIGKAIALFLQEKNFIVYGTSRFVENNTNSDVSLLRLDVRERESIQSLVKIILEKHKRIDILINNAGVGITGAVEEVPIAEIQNNFNTNFFGPLALIQEILPSMRANKSGLIINITSLAAYMGLPYRGIYSASKASLEILSEALRMEVEPFGIEVTTVAPGDFATNIASRRFHSEVIKDSAYEKIYQQQLNTINKDVNQGLDTKVMAEAIYKIICSKNKKVHYQVGAFMQKFSITLKKLLPDTWYEKLLKNHYKL